MVDSVKLAMLLDQVQYALENENSATVEKDMRELAVYCGVPKDLIGFFDRADLSSLYSAAAASSQSSTPAALESTVRRLVQRYRAQYGQQVWQAFPPPNSNPLTQEPGKSSRTMSPEEEAAMRAAIKRLVQQQQPVAPSSRKVPAQVPVQVAEELEKRVNALEVAMHVRTLEIQTLEAKSANPVDVDAIAADLRGELESIAARAVQQNTPVILQVQRAGNPAPVAMGTVHRCTPAIIQMLSAGVNVYLHGPAGSGKTTAARNAADALGVAFYFAAKVESEYLLLGFKDARGDTVRTQFRDAYENGGLFLFDEMDASSPAAIVALNAALANGVCPFPDGTVKRHENFYCIGAGNTTLSGANRQYVGRSQLDAASIDRFAFLEFGYDEALELELAADKDWAAHVQAVRAAVKERGINHLVTPRATFDGCKLLAAGLEFEQVENACIFKGLDADTVAQIRTSVKRRAPAPQQAVPYSVWQGNGLPPLDAPGSEDRAADIVWAYYVQDTHGNPDAFNKIDCIRTLRCNFKASLSEAKQFVETQIEKINKLSVMERTKARRLHPFVYGNMARNASAPSQREAIISWTAERFEVTPDVAREYVAKWWQAHAGTKAAEADEDTKIFNALYGVRD